MVVNGSVNSGVFHEKIDKVLFFSQQLVKNSLAAITSFFYIKPI